MKYIIDIPNADVSRWIGETPLGKKLYVPISVEDGKEYSVGTGIYAEEYTEPDLSPLVDEAVETIENEVWEFERCVHKMNGSDYFECFGIAHIFDEDHCTKYSYQEAKAKYEAWKKQKDEIHIGDEVKENSGLWTGVVVGFDEFDALIIMDSSGKSCGGYKTKFFRKTGRHFDEIEDLLKKMRDAE